MKAIKIFLIACILFALFIVPIVDAHCVEKLGREIKMKNLEGQECGQRFKINEMITTTYTAAKEVYEKSETSSAYQLSMPLIAAAQQGNKNLYNKILPKMQRALNFLPKEENAKKAWLLGRVLLAADSIKDHITANRVRPELENMLKEKSMPENAFSAWATGYLAGSNKDTYKQFKEAMLSSASKLTQQYVAAKLKLKDVKETKENKESLKDLATNAIWAWVMDLQAAANNKDRDTFNLIVENIKDMTQQSSVSSALSEGLSPDDYRAWAYGIVQLAAANMGDKELYDELKEPLQLSLAAAKESGVKTEEMLGLVNSTLAIIEWDKYSQNQTQSLQQPAFNS